MRRAAIPRAIQIWMILSNYSLLQTASSFHLTRDISPSLCSSSSYLPFSQIQRRWHQPQNLHQCCHHHQHCRKSLLNSKGTDQDDPNQYEYYRPQSRGAPQGGDMAYTEENVRRSAETFQSIRKIGGVECTNDVYARGKNRFEFWYVGKIARTTGTITLHQGISRIWNLIEEHACRLRPVELGREYGTLEIWCSKEGDTEILSSQATAKGNAAEDEAWSLVKMEKNVLGSGSDKVSALEVGFIAEVVTNQGQGFYIVRDNEGKLMQ
mmetsp:Transcript_15785/g.23716  ORF Transcript_15785/g.23716 Transcript_15785/m.23716 type:complete len:266 (+) Transcript_15785:86-883(+)